MTQEETPENTDDKPGLTIMQMVCTHSEQPADNLNALHSITEFLNDSVIGMGNTYGNSFHDVSDGLSYLFQIVSHDLKVMSETLPPFIKGFRKRKSEA